MKVMFVDIIDTGSFSKVVLSQGAVNQVFLGVFLMFLAFFHSKIWAKFHFGTFKPYDQKKVEKIYPQKTLNFRVGSKLHIFCSLVFVVFCP